MMKSEIYQPIVPRTLRELPVRHANYCIYEWGDPDAPLVVYLHGWGDTGSTIQFVVDALQSDWRVIAPDWRGFGRSTCACSSYWFPDYLADLHGLLKVYSPREPVRLIGHSMGANVGSLYAGTMPERVRAFVNIEGFGLVDSDPEDAPRRYHDWINAEAASAQFSTYRDFDALALRIRKRSPGMSPAAAAFVAREWAEAEPAGEVRLRADPRHKLPNPVLYRRSEAAACWRATTAEILLVEGSESRFVANSNSVASHKYPQAAKVSIEGAGHMLHFEAAAALAAAGEDFLRKTL